VDTGECSRIEELMRLARVRMPREDACKAIRDIDALLSQLRDLKVEEEPLYYIWEEGQQLPPEPIVHEPRGRSLIPGERLDEEGRVKLPWKGGG